MLVEAAVVGGLAAVSLGSGLMLLPALAVPPFTAGLRRGVRGMGLALSVEVVVLLLVSLRLYGGLAADEASNTLTAVLTGIGLGLIASHVHSQLQRPPDPLTPYRDAQRLLRDLIDLSGTLGSGLDATTLGSRIAVTVRDQLPLLAVTVFVPRYDELAPLVTGAAATSVDDTPLVELATDARNAHEAARQRPGVRGAPHDRDRRRGRGRRRAAAAARPAPAALLGPARGGRHLARGHRGAPRHRPAVLQAP